MKSDDSMWLILCGGLIGFVMYVGGALIAILLLMLVKGVLI